MGWSGATPIFDTVVEDLLETPNLHEDDFNRILYNLALVMEDMDWDTACESEYWNHPRVKQVFIDLGHEIEEEDE